MHVVGARPNFMKNAPVIREMARYPDVFDQLLVHTGQHYDPLMSQVFFDELELPRPDVNLEVGSGSHAWQTAEVMLRFEPVVLEHKPDWVIVVGDVNSTLACSLVCSKLGIRVAHVEAGLRSNDRSMPEEINRILTDQLSDLLFTPSEDANMHLYNEGIPQQKVHLVGNVMIDTLVDLLPRAEKHWPELKEKYDLVQYILVTLHRPSNVDDPLTLKEIMSALGEISEEITVLFPVHPRTRRQILDSNVPIKGQNLILLDPLGYLDFLALQTHAVLVLTDSGGLQEETTYLGIPCLTARSNTERPITISMGTNRLVESKAEALKAAIRLRMKETIQSNPRPPLWDGHAAERIVHVFRMM
jgi:UDP-N-acetylglucosamine 2-epimerase (non-hydrolysing)